jgi:crotonobetainyl-CoA:carnitine CoA-transferase CaiB-like acyl-CoA transferase
MLDCLLGVSALQTSEYWGSGREPRRLGTAHPRNAPYQAFAAADGELTVAAGNDRLWGAVTEVVGRPELADDPRFATHQARGENQAEIEGIVAEWARARTATEIDRVLNDAGVICGPIYTVADIFDDPQYQARDMLVKHVDPDFGEYVGPGIVPKFSGTPCEVRWSATWDEGSHNRDVYGGLLGLSDAELDELKEEGVL